MIQKISMHPQYKSNSPSFGKLEIGERIQSQIKALDSDYSELSLQKNSANLFKRLKLLWLGRQKKLVNKSISQLENLSDKSGFKIFVGAIVYPYDPKNLLKITNPLTGKSIQKYLTGSIKKYGFARSLNGQLLGSNNATKAAKKLIKTLCT